MIYLVCSICDSSFKRTEKQVKQAKNGVSCSLSCKNKLSPASHRRGDLKQQKRNFWSKVSFLAGQGPKGDCWEWSGLKHYKGYGITRDFVVPIESFKAHRASWYSVHGIFLKPEQLVCHRCDNPPCVRPSHLFIGSALDNMRDAKNKDRLAKGSRLSKKLTESQVRVIKFESLNKTVKDLANLYSVNETTIRAILKNKYWKHVT